MTEETLQKSVILPKNAEIEGAVFHNMIEIPENLARKARKETFDTDEYRDVVSKTGNCFE